MAFGVKMTVKNLFFDRAHVVREVGKLNAKALSKAGSFVRRRARSSLRRRKKVSSPGSPPSVHSSDSVATLKNILYGYDRANQSVAIGPVRLNMVIGGLGGSTTVPQLMEFGGVARIQEEQIKVRLGKTVTPSQLRAATNAEWRRSDLRRSKKPWKRYRIRQATYPARPFMGPALAAEAPNFPSLWASSAKGAA